MLTDPPPRFSPAGSPVDRLRATLPLVTAEDGSPVLPGFILWAFSFNEGDLLAVSPGEVPDGSCRFISYAEGVWSAAEGCAQPWPYVEELLRRPMAGVGPGGALRLPEEAEALRTGGQLLLRAERHGGERSFTLEPVDGPLIPPELLLHALYRLPVLPGFQVRLPADVRWVLGLEEGDELVCQASLAMAAFEPCALIEPCELKKLLKDRDLTVLRPGGLLSLPDSLRVPAALAPDARVRLEVTLSPSASLRVTQWARLE